MALGAHATFTEAFFASCSAFAFRGISRSHVGAYFECLLYLGHRSQRYQTPQESLICGVTRPYDFYKFGAINIHNQLREIIV